jgi:hypothetical protein
VARHQEGTSRRFFEGRFAFTSGTDIAISPDGSSEPPAGGLEHLHLTLGTIGKWRPAE